MYVIVCKHIARYSVKLTCPKNHNKWKTKMSEEQLRQLQRQLWSIADALRGKMNADEFRDYILGFIFYKYLSEKMVAYANKMLVSD